MDDGRKLDVGHVLETQQGTFVVSGVQYQDTDEGHKNFTYQIKDPVDLVAEEEAEAKEGETL